MELLIGTDPEAFLSLDGKFVSAYGVIPGTKAEPYPVEKGAVQVDGLALEFNIDPARTADEFDSNIQTVLDQMTEMVKKVNSRYEIKFVPVAKFDMNYFKSLPEESKILGCDPDFNAAGTRNQVFDYLTNTPIRTAAGHMHVGFTKDADVTDPVYFEDCRFLASQFNMLPPNVLHLGTLPTPEDYERWGYYGAYGAFRPKHYGVELRSFGNWWVPNSDTRKKMFNMVVTRFREIENATKKTVWTAETPIPTKLAA